MRTLFILLLFFSCFSATAQNGDWQVLYPNFSAKCVAAQGNTILVGTDGAGLSVYDTLGNQQHLHTANSSIPSNRILQTAIDPQGHWWVSTEAGFSRFDGTDWESWGQAAAGLSGSDVVRVLKAAPDGSIYAGTQLAGAVFFKNDTWQQLNTSNSGLPSNNISDITFGQNGYIYFATSAGLAIFDGTDWTIHNAASTGLLTFNNVKSVAVMDNGTVWAAINVNRFAKMEAGTWTEMVAADIGLTGAGLSGGVFYDEFDRLWLTHTKTISVLVGGNWTHYPETEVGCTFPGGLQTSVFLAVDGAGRTWATACGLSWFDGQTWGQLPTTNSGLPNGYVFSISEDAGGNIWFGTTDGIGQLDPNGNWSDFNPADFGATSVYADVYDVLSASNGDVWFGLDEGEMLRLNGAGWALFDTCSTAFPTWSQLNVFIRASAEAPNGDLWFSVAPTAGFGAKLARYSAITGWSFFDPINTPDIIYNDIEAIAFEATGTGWFATTNAGLFRFDGTDWTVFKAANSDLPDDHVHDVAIAPDGSLWACTEAGIARYDGTDWTVLNTSNSGLPFDKTYRIAFDGLGGMYVGYDIPDEGPQVVEFRNSEWTELAAPGFENVVASQPYAFTVDSKNRLWFTQVYYNFQNSLAPVFRYDPIVSGTGEGVDKGFQITAFPNPTANNVSLQWQTRWSGEALLQVRNAQGQVVQTASLSIATGESISVNLSGLPAGVYWLTVYQGSRVATVRVVKR